MSNEEQRLRFALKMVARHATCRDLRDRNPADCLAAAIGVAERALSFPEPAPVPGTSPAPETNPEKEK